MNGLIMYQRPIFGRREGSIGTIISFYFKILSLVFFFDFFFEKKKCGDK